MFVNLFPLVRLLICLADIKRGNLIMCAVKLSVNYKFQLFLRNSFLL